MYGFVYMTTNKINNMKYIGKCEYSRKNGWENYLGSGTYFKRALATYGREAFTREILAEAKSKYELEALEEGFIHYYNAVHDPNFYNLKQTSIGGDTFTTNPRKEYIRELKSIKARGKNNPQYEAVKTEKMINSVKEANSKKVVANGVLYNSLTEASKDLGVAVSTINYRLDSEGFPNYIRLSPKKDMTGRIVSNKKRAVSVEGVTYESIAEASRCLGCSKAKVKGRVKSEDFPTWFIV